MADITIQANPFGPRPSAGSLAAKSPVSATFGETLKNAIGAVNSMHAEADEAIRKIQVENKGSLHDAMIAMEKADISFRTMLQVRNKVLDAYQEVMRMSV